MNESTRRSAPGPCRTTRRTAIVGGYNVPEKIGESILLVEQNAWVALHVIDCGYVLETSRIELEGPAAQQADNRRAVETYLVLSTKTQTEWS